MRWFRDWRRARILKEHALDTGLWRETVARYPFTAALADSECARLRELATLFLHEKAIQGAGGMIVHEAARVAIATQACILILNLDLDYYRGWVEVIVYPDEFVARYEYIDEAGVAHNVAEPMSGESWERGPVILSWADAQDTRADGSAYNVVIHEFAHKLDMLNGAPNGFPPLHADMDRARWAAAFSGAYDDFCRKVDRGDALSIDDYAAESPAEFFAVMSEAFFEAPAELLAIYPVIYEELVRFYKQDPAARMAGAGRADVAASA